MKLSPEAVKRLGIETVVVKIDTAAATRSLGGEVTVPEGRLVTVTAPVAGTLSVVSGMQPGARVTRGTRLMTLAPLASSERDQSIEARRAVEAAQAEAEAARLRLQRLEQLLKDGAASVRSVEEARAQLQISEAALNAARERLTAVRQGPVGPQGEIAITAPLDGIIQIHLGGSGTDGRGIGSAASDRAGQHAVGAGAGVCRRRRPDRRGAASRRHDDSAAPTRRSWRRRVTAPLKADPSAASVDLYYELPGDRLRAAARRARDGGGAAQEHANRASSCRRPQCCTTSTATPGCTRTSAGNAYARRRVQIARHAGDRAVIARGLAEGAKVVTAGAAELFGTEFGAGH